MSQYRPNPAEATAGGLIQFASGNAHKITEVEMIVGDVLGPGWQVVACPVDVEETGESFEANALIKARAAGGPDAELEDARIESDPEPTHVVSPVVIADDSGIEIDALDGRPGINSARWTAEDDWIPRVLRELEGVEPEARTARYVAAIAAVWPDGRSEVVRGTVDGHIANEPRGDAGFGYDPIFIPIEGDGRTFAEMTEAEKHALSHRARALRAIAPLLTNP